MDIEMSSKKTDTYQSLRYRIITHDLKPMQTLNEKDLMSHYDIGRTPLREILIQLQRDGLIQRFPRSATVVAPVDIQLYQEIIEIRIQLEKLAGRLASQRITAEQLEGLRQVLRRVDDIEKNDPDNLKAIMECELDFHRIVYEATHNSKLREFLLELHGISARFWHYQYFGQQELLAQFVDHRKTLAALEKSDGKLASATMEKHIQNVINKIRDKVLK
jgi:DNA-binding GntR family transcriptional regulator